MPPWQICTVVRHAYSTAFTSTFSRQMRAHSATRIQPLDMSNSDSTPVVMFGHPARSGLVDKNGQRRNNHRNTRIINTNYDDVPPLSSTTIPSPSHHRPASTTVYQTSAHASDATAIDIGLQPTINRHWIFFRLFALSTVSFLLCASLPIIFPGVFYFASRGSTVLYAVTSSIALSFVE